MCPFSGYSCNSSHMHAICATHMRHQLQKATSQLFKWLVQLLLAPFHTGLGFVCDSRSAALSSAAQMQQVHKVGEMLTIFFLTFSPRLTAKSSCFKLAVQDPNVFCWISIISSPAMLSFYEKDLETLLSLHTRYLVRTVSADLRVEMKRLGIDKE